MLPTTRTWRTSWPVPGVNEKRNLLEPETIAAFEVRL
jgi:hypothetical protein